MNRLEFHRLTEANLGDMIDVLARARVDDPYERRMTLDEARESTFLDPDFDPEGSWMAVEEGETVGFGFCLVERNRVKAGMNDGFVDIDVVPERRDKGIEQKLLDKALDYLRSRGVDKALSKCRADDGRMFAFLSANSFEEAFRVYILKRLGRQKVRGAPLVEGVDLERKALVDFSDEEIASFVDLFNEAFQDHLNFAPERKERFLNFRDCSEDSRVMTLARNGSEVVGFCLSEESAIMNKERGIATGWIDILGVRPSHRRRGIGRALLADGISWILDQGMDTVYLGAFAKNEKALDLYRSYDFSKDRESIWMSRNLG